LKDIFQFADKCPFPIYIFEKPNVNRLEEKQITKDGIHMLIGIQADRTTQTIIRQRVMGKIEEEWGDLPLTNTWEDVLDKGISTGVTNWQLYGSKNRIMTSILSRGFMNTNTIQLTVSLWRLRYQ